MSVSGNSAKRSPRVSRPSVKKLEAEEGNKLFCEIVAKKQKKSVSAGSQCISGDKIGCFEGRGQLDIV